MSIKQSSLHVHGTHFPVAYFRLTLAGYLQFKIKGNKMEEILLNPGYHFIVQKILSYLSTRSLLSLSQTSKGIMKVCAIKEERWKREREHILVQFLEKLTEFTKRKHHHCLEKQISKYCGCLSTHVFPILEVGRKIKQIFKQYVKFIPSNCPTESKDYLMRFLAFAISWKEMDMVKVLLASLKNHDTCLRLIISAMESNRIKHESLEAHLKRMNDKAPFMEKIASQCKNPNAPNKFGYTALHLVAKLGLDKIAKVLIPFSNNLDARNKYGKTALDIAIQWKHHKTVKILNSAL